MKVIGAGFGRTGTMSMKVALERLGFGPCYHMIEVIDNPEHAPKWLAAARGELADWDDLLGGYGATVDWPGCSFWVELMEAYPEAKVVLNVRDPERWYQSVDNTFLHNLRQARAAGLPPPEEMRHLFELIIDGTFHGRIEDREYAIGVFRRHNERVRQAVPPERLLVYEVGQGWDPLCEFLGAARPDEPFPHLNDTASFHRIFGDRLREGRA
ncbi:MAG: sulfotransferase family protein [Streptosporangiales bacterium]|nr:sulfotransferase family protein [Streptosporangiales bacterium]